MAFRDRAETSGLTIKRRRSEKPSKITTKVALITKLRRCGGSVYRANTPAGAVYRLERTLVVVASALVEDGIRQGWLIPDSPGLFPGTPQSWRLR
jgi:hypothetical protein